MRISLEPITCRAPGVLAAVALGLGACSSTTHPSVFEVSGDPASTELTISVETCHRHPKLTAEETLTEIRLKVTADADTEEDCADAATVMLKAPLRERVVIDDASGDRLTVLPPAG